MALIDRPPSKWLGALFRVPAFLYLHGMGWLFGKRLLMLSHRGRRTGVERHSVLEVVAREDDPPVWYVAAAWGDRADWYRNLDAHPYAEVTVGRRRRRVATRPLSPEEAAPIFDEYVRRHRLAARFVGRAIGVDLARSDPVALGARMPLVALAAVEPTS